MVVLFYIRGNFLVSSIGKLLISYDFNSRAVLIFILTVHTAVLYSCSSYENVWSLAIRIDYGFPGWLLLYVVYLIQDILQCEPNITCVSLVLPNYYEST